MNTKKRARRTWMDVHAYAQSAQRSVVRVERRDAEHPRNAGARLTTTWPVGQLADYAIEIPDEAPLSIREFNDHFEAFVNTVDLGTQLVRALENNPDATMLLGGALVGSALGSSITNKREGALLGAGLGLLAAALLNDKPSRRR